MDLTAVAAHIRQSVHVLRDEATAQRSHANTDAAILADSAADRVAGLHTDLVAALRDLAAGYTTNANAAQIGGGHDRAQALDDVAESLLDLVETITNEATAAGFAG